MEKQYQIKITLQPEIYENVKKNARKNMRTLSAEINFMLKQVYTNDEKPESSNTNETDATPITTSLRRRGDLW